jgi:hypothetical protein
MRAPNPYPWKQSDRNYELPHTRDAPHVDKGNIQVQKTSTITSAGLRMRLV